MAIFTGLENLTAAGMVDPVKGLKFKKRTRLTPYRDLEGEEDIYVSRMPEGYKELRYKLLHPEVFTEEVEGLLRLGEQELRLAMPEWWDEPSPPAYDYPRTYEPAWYRQWIDTGGPARASQARQAQQNVEVARYLESESERRKGQKFLPFEGAQAVPYDEQGRPIPPTYFATPAERSYWLGERTGIPSGETIETGKYGERIAPSLRPPEIEQRLDILLRTPGKEAELAEFLQTDWGNYIQGLGGYQPLRVIEVGEVTADMQAEYPGVSVGTRIAKLSTGHVLIVNGDIAAKWTGQLPSQQVRDALPQGAIFLGVDQDGQVSYLPGGAIQQHITNLNRRLMVSRPGSEEYEREFNRPVELVSIDVDKLSDDEIDQARRWVMASPTNALQYTMLMRSIGRNDQTEALIRRMAAKPVSDDDMSQLFGETGLQPPAPPAGKIPPGEGEVMRQGTGLVANPLYAGLINYISQSKRGLLTTAKTAFPDMPPLPVDDETLTPNERAARERINLRRARLSESNKELRATFSRLQFQEKGKYEDWLDKNPQFKAPEGYEGITDPKEWLTKAATDPGFLPDVIARQAAPTIAALGAATLVGFTTGNPMLAMGAAFAAFQPMQVQDVADDLTAAGAPEELVDQLAVQVGSLISALDLVGELPLLSVIPGPFRAIGKVFRKGAQKAVIDATMAALWKKGLTTFTTIQFGETLTEVAQNAIQNYTVSFFDKNRHTFDNTGVTILQTMAQTSVFGAAGAHMGVRQQLQDSKKALVDAGVPDDWANVEALNQFAATPKGEAALTDLTNQMVVEAGQGTLPSFIQRLVREETGAIEIPGGKQPWRMTREEFNKEIRFHGTGVTQAEAIRKSGLNPGSYIASYAGTAQLHAGAAERPVVFLFRNEPSVGALGKTTSRLMPIAEIPVAEAREAHKFLVKQALSEGKAVPSEVLKDYPDLAKLIPKAAPGMPEAGLQPSMLPEQVAAKEVFPQGKGRITQISMEEQRQLEEARAGEQFEAAGIADFLQTDPVATFTVAVGKKRVHLDYFFKKGDWPESFTLKEAAALTMKPVEQVQTRVMKAGVPTNRVPSAYVIDELAEHFNMTEEQLIKRIENLYNMKARLQQLRIEPALEPGQAEVTLARPPEGVPAEGVPPPVAPEEVIPPPVPPPPEAAITEPEKPKRPNPKELAEQLAKARAQISELREAKAEAKDVKAIISNLAQSVLPPEVQGTMLTNIRDAKTHADLTETLNKITAVGENYMQVTVRDEIDDELAKAKPKKVEGILKGKFIPEVQDWLDMVRANRNVNRDEVRSKIADVLQQHAENKISEESMREQLDALAYAGIDGMNSDELQEVLADIKSMKEIGKTVRGQQEEKVRERIAALKEQAVKEVTGGKGLKPGTGVLDARELQAKQNLLGKLTDSQLAFGNLLDEISKLSGTLPYQSTLSKFERTVQQARNEENAGLNLYQQLIINRFGQIYDLKDAGQINAKLNQLENKKVALGDFKVTNREGKTETVHMEKTKAQIMQHYLWQQDPTLLDTYRKGMGWTYEINRAMADALTEEDVKFADSLIEFYRDYFPSIDAVYKELYGVHLPNNPNYSPLLRDFDSTQPENVMMYKDLAHYASVLNGSLKSRVRNILPLHDTSAIANIINHVEQMEHFKAWAFPMRDMRRVFGDKTVRTAIQQYHSKPVMDKVDHYLDMFARGGVDRMQVIRNLDKLRGNFSTAVLGLKPHIAIQQIPTILGYMTEMPVGDFFSGVGDFWAHPIENYKWIREHSTYIKARYEQGFERDIRTAMTKKKIADWSGKASFVEKVYFLIESGDKLGVIPGWWAKYKSALKQGLSEQEAMIEADLSTNRTQNTSDVETMSSIQNGGSFMKLLTMFQNQPNKYFRVMVDNMRNMKYGRGDRGKAVTNILVVSVLLPALYALIANAFRARKDDLIKEAALSPVNNLLIFGNMARAIEGWLSGDGYTYQASPVLNSMQELQNGIGKARKLYRDGRDPFKDIAIDDVIGLSEFLAKAGGQIFGLPTPYLVNVERALRGTKTKTGETERDLRELVYSRWALGKVERPEIQQQLEIATAGLGQVVELTEKQKEAQRKAGMGLEPRMKGTEGLSSDFRKILGHLLHEDITEKNGYSKLAVAWAEMEATRDESDVLPNIKLKDYVNEDFTPEQLGKQWQARGQIKSLQELKEYDSVWSRGYLGNLTRRQVELVNQYIGADPETRKQLEKDNPELNQIPRDEWLRANAEGNARQALWGQARPLTQAAYDKMWELARALDIPDSAMPKGVPPKEVAKAFFGYQDLLKTVEAGSLEARLHRVDNPDFDKWGQKAYDWKPVEIKSVDAARLQVKNKVKQAEFDAIRGKDVLETEERRQAFLGKNPDFAKDRLRIDAFNKGLTGNVVDDYAGFYEKSLKGYEDDWYLMEHPDFYQAMTGGADPQWKQRDFTKVPSRRVGQLYTEYQALPENGRKPFRKANPDLDDWLIKTQGYKPLTEEAKAGSPFIPVGTRARGVAAARPAPRVSAPRAPAPQPVAVAARQPARPPIMPSRSRGRSVTSALRRRGVLR